MGRQSVPPARPALSVLVIGADGRHPSVPVTTTPGEVLVTHALTLPAALTTLAADSFDCVLVEVGSADPATIVDVLRAVRARAGDAALVVTHGDADGTPLDGLADLVVDPYAGPSEWPAVLQHAAENARLRIRLSELERSITHLSGIVDTVADAVFAIDIDGRITSWNKGAARLYGYPAAEVVGRDVAVLHPPGSHERRQLL